MSLGHRFKTSFVLVVIFVLVLGIWDMLLSIGWAATLLSPRVVVPAFAVAWLVAPAVTAKFPLE